MGKVLTSNAVTVFDSKTGGYKFFTRGHEFTDGDDDHLTSQLDDFHFQVPEGEENTGGPVFYEELRVAELLELCKERGLKPATSSKKDLITALEAADAEDEA